ncbi:TIGR03747 family integrating conjugative element membrane protein [Pseudomonas veronii]|jgi:integrating conjugative element membrane protein (TIGR03747 family)|uniref:TIGR03747 family integrating conjugative element membrane protein n=2 Tax=Pseudomonas fluorescens group TaxID=136843 RepID=A0ABS9F9J4_9PSED|nr:MULTISPECIES: TIGR03747 family integrating conjugative element membrane protein [Pseudomonas]MCF4981940.1 TIGR03747 family integrating conjugative element membrane protein [Pseudomonas gessardii]MCF4992497.1 TIGR03747 family integrating conjugative element membrane protein [Pseudomonas gessardii]MCF5087931.1 TIGR03747 family integrating conjugative element membrane protein [Pseudomonas gessardii]MCF5098726.1 TIGR03747 family integrating conjugative element membrane protein [Pseudomonas gessa
MATSVQNTPPQPIQRPGLIVSAIGLVLRIIGMLIASLLFSILIEFAGLLLFWGDQGWRHSQAMLNSELGWLSEHFKASLILRQPEKTIIRWLDILNQWLLVKSGFADFAQQARASSQSNGFWSWANQLYVSIEDFVLAAVYVTFTFVVRLTILVLATPLFLLASFTGFVDGLMRRDLRKFGAGRESSFVYHRAKRAVVPLLFVPWIIYLSLPFTLNPMAILLPCAVILGTTVAITATTFKKHL